MGSIAKYTTNATATIQRIGCTVRPLPVAVAMTTQAMKPIPMPLAMEYVNGIATIVRNAGSATRKSVKSMSAICAIIIAPTTTAMVDFVTRVVGWKVDARYQALNYDVNRLWDRNGELRQGAVTQLRQAVAIDPHLQVLIVHGWNDLSCPFMGSILTVDQMPTMGSNPDRVQVRSYPGGHMFYSRADSQAAFRRDVQALFQRN